MKYPLYTHMYIYIHKSINEIPFIHTHVYIHTRINGIPFILTHIYIHTGINKILLYCKSRILQIISLQIVVVH